MWGNKAAGLVVTTPVPEDISLESLASGAFFPLDAGLEWRQPGNDRK
jgi:hypothetical protein